MFSDRPTSRGHAKSPLGRFIAQIDVGGGDGRGADGVDDRERNVPVGRDVSTRCPTAGGASPAIAVPTGGPRPMTVVPEEIASSTGSLRDGPSPFDDGFASRPGSGGFSHPHHSTWNCDTNGSGAFSAARVDLGMSPSCATAPLPSSTARVPFGERLHTFRSHSPRRPQWSGDAEAMREGSGDSDDGVEGDGDHEFADELFGEHDEDSGLAFSGDTASPTWRPIDEHEDPLEQMSLYRK